MKLIIDNETYIPIYRAKSDFFELEYNAFLSTYQKSFIVSTIDFQSLYDALMLHISYWVLDFEENTEISNIEELIFDIEGLDFYKFFYDVDQWFPVEFINTYDGTILYDESILEITHDLKYKEIDLKLEDGESLILLEEDFLKTFNLNNKSEIVETISSLSNSAKLYFDGGHYYFLNEKNIKKAMLYMIEQVVLLNKIYSRFKLPEINIL